MSENILEGQARLEAYVERTLYENNVRQKDRDASRRDHVHSLRSDHSGSRQILCR